MPIIYTTKDFKKILIPAGVQLCLWANGDNLSIKTEIKDQFLKVSTPKNILFLHGYLDTAKSFWPIMKLMSKYKNLNCYSLSFRGHGESENVRSGGSYHQLDHLKDLSLVIDYFKHHIGEINLLVGHSMGGIIASLYCAALPDSVHDLLLLDSLGAPSEHSEQQISRLSKVLKEVIAKKSRTLNFKKAKSLKQAQKRILRNNPNLTKLGAYYMSVFTLNKDFEGHFYFPFDSNLRGTTPIRYEEAMWVEVYKQIKAKVHFIRAAKGYIPLQSEYLKRFDYIPNATMETFKDCGHHLHVDAPKKIVLSIKKFFPDLF